MSTTILFVACIALVYFAVSLQIFNWVYEASSNVIDELFHIPQGIQYCNLNFTYWDPKITTLPGLYLISTILVRPFSACTPYALRFTNLIASSVNFYLFYSIMSKVNNQNRHNHFTLIQALNLSLLPPLYFFSHLYYTDTVSLLSVLLFIKLHMDKRNFIFIILCGSLSIILRQTNVIWIAFCLGQTIINILVSSYFWSNKSSKNEKKNYKTYSLHDIYVAFLFHIRTRLKVLFSLITINIISEILSLIVILIGFILFVYINGSIVVGDKTAHTASLHIPQMFYFTLFYAIFSIPYVLLSLKYVMTKIYNNKLLFILSFIICAVIIYCNTLVHPYLLADNRHYTFYIWNKLFGKYPLFKFIVIPLYLIFTLSIVYNIKDNVNGGFLVSFLICLFVSVSLQKMIEVRYFFIPFVIMKMRFNNSHLSVLLFDLLISLVLNVVTLNIFFNKEIIWEDFDDVQRLIW